MRPPMRSAPILGCACIMLLAACARESSTPASPGGNPAAAVQVPAWSPDELAAYFAQMEKAEANEDLYVRCTTSPDLPGNRWPRNAAIGECLAFKIDEWSLQNLQATLSKRDGVRQLDAKFRKALEDHFSNPGTDHRIDQAFTAFEEGDLPEHVAGIWLEQSPDSPYAMTALGWVYYSNAARERGSRWISLTSRSQLGGMQRWLQRAQPLFERALALEPRLSSACAGLISVGRMDGDDALVQRSIRHCERVDPSSTPYMFARWMASLPKWGGQPGQLEAFDRDLESRVEANPGLSHMRNSAKEALADQFWQDGQAAAALPLQLEVSREGPNPDALSDVGKILGDAGNRQVALVYLSQALRFQPNNRYFLNRRIETHYRNGDFAPALHDIDRLVELGRATALTYSLPARISEKQGDFAAAKDAYQKAMSDDKYRQWAQTGWCDIIVRRDHDLAGALACTDGLVSSYPNDPMSNFMRAWVLTENAQPGAEEAARRFFALPQGLDARQADMASQLTALRGRMAKPPQ